MEQIKGEDNIKDIKFRKNTRSNESGDSLEEKWKRPRKVKVIWCGHFNGVQKWCKIHQQTNFKVFDSDKNERVFF